MKTKLHITYSDIYLRWLLGAGDGSHPTNPIRAKLATELLQQQLGERVNVIIPNPDEKRESDMEKLTATHDPDYVLRTMNGDNAQWYRTDTDVAEAGFAMFQGTIRAVELILSGEAKVVFNPQGAKHHARYAQGAGFCIFNDMVYAAMELKDAGLRPLYIDWDIHAGDGVFHMLKGQGIPTISIHNSTGYPMDRELQSLDDSRREVVDGENLGYGINVLSGDGDDVFKAAIDRARGIIDDYQPDVILLAAGADGHTGIGNLGAITNYTAEGFKYAAEMVAEQAIKHAQGRVIIGGAGGYQPLKETPETWALVVSTIYDNGNQGE